MRAGPLREEEVIDLPALVRASQALAAESSVAGAMTRMAELMGSLCAAAKTRLALRADGSEWLVFEGHGDEALPADEARRRGLLPEAAMREVEASGRPLFVADIFGDPRFACSRPMGSRSHRGFAIVPVAGSGTPHAMLLMALRGRRGAISPAKLDAIALLAGQLAATIENTLLHERLAGRVRRQSSELLATARRSGMAQVATNVLHNVGNVLNSVNVSIHLLDSQLRTSRAARLGDLAALIEEAAASPSDFFAPDAKGRRLPSYLRELESALALERLSLLEELVGLAGHVQHIRNVVEMQQSYARSGGVLELFTMVELAEDALCILGSAALPPEAELERDYGPVTPMPLDKARVMQILVNLLENARQAMTGIRGPHRLRLEVRQGGDAIRVSVTDTGCGIAGDNLPRIFSHGFTTKATGHGFGLHSCAVAASEMGGTLTAHSEGIGRGATFTLRLPLQP